jgi:hypothetical protein
MSVYCLHIFFIMPNPICSGGNKTLHISTRWWWAIFFVPGVRGLQGPVLLAVVNTLGMTITISGETTEFCVTLLQSNQKGNYLQITADVLLICRVVHVSENFLHVFTCFLFVDNTGKRDWRHRLFPLCNTALRLSLIIPHIHCSHQTLNILPNTELKLCYEEQLKIFFGKS